MTLANLNTFERAFDRATPALFIVLGLFLAVATVGLLA